MPSWASSIRSTSFWSRPLNSIHFPTMRFWRANCVHTSKPNRRAAAIRIVGKSVERERANDRFSCCRQSVGAEPGQLCGSHGTRRANLRGNLTTTSRFVSRLRMAAGRGDASSGTRGAFCFRIPDSTTSGCETGSGPCRAQRGFCDLHAWAGVSAGRGLDWLRSTSGLLAGEEGHIPLACTPDTGNAAPISGLVDRCNTDFFHEMSVQRIYESPRVTKPYLDEQWRAIESLGHLVDTRLRAADVRLTMGGEPTFTSLDDADGPEWMGEAMSPAKRKLAVELLGRLRDHFAPQAMLHYGQGKWYPGEALPRWALSCYWRKDHVPIWGKHASNCKRTTKITVTPAKMRGSFSKHWAAACKWTLRFTMRAYEDSFYYLWKERRLPVNVVTRFKTKKTPSSRKHVARVFEQKGWAM